MSRKRGPNASRSDAISLRRGSGCRHFVRGATTHLPCLPLASPAGPASTAWTCPTVSAEKVGAISVPAGPIAGYCQDRVINAARSLGIGQHTQAIGVMNAMRESGLVNLAVGADNPGLFQHRANGAWGTLTDRITP